MVPGTLGKLKPLRGVCKALENFVVKQLLPPNICIGNLLPSPNDLANSSLLVAASGPGSHKFQKTLQFKWLVSPIPSTHSNHQDPPWSPTRETAGVTHVSHQGGHTAGQVDTASGLVFLTTAPTCLQSPEDSWARAALAHSRSLSIPSDWAKKTGESLKPQK